MFHMRQEIADRDANIRKMYKNERYLQGFNYSYDMPSRKGINDGGSDMYDKGNIVSKINLLLFRMFYIQRKVFNTNYRR